ncbi:MULTISPECIES: SAG1250 family conjugative relaxase [Streptococcus]|jgi:relaxase|nr:MULTISPECIES: SAG1250 family conjugative relaxase [Streptococcus]HER1572285.1 relaxase/mobilization nuclease domain-containing protein [Streptococcus pyogenes]MBZ2095727.1 relaxase/mobilization nuclease domain-containing protein [Streptococcus oralis]MBZ2102730.1 relaxase/mobilization nuclease domain-containing protein [Streptococcus oralis]MBZ2106977.1 relaxase/mobilization nuclease domain-containing protein [Streptococcus mitis]MBZ2114252.1 relaxase/mobilization nuclease domain-containing
MVVTKHFAIHGKNYRSKLIKYILNPSKTKNLTLVSDFGMRNYLDFPSYKELVKMYNDNFLSNDTLYEIRHDRQEANQRKIHSHHIIQSFSPDDHLTPEQINQIGYETVKELTGGRFRFIVATHVDKDHIHNHIILNSIDKNSDKKFLWDYKAERNLRMVSDRLSKIVGAKIIENRYSHHQYEVYRKTNYKYEIKQRVYFLIENSKNFEDFKKKAKALHLKIDFRHKHVTYFMTDSNMKQVVRDSKLSRKQPYNETYFKKKFVQREIINILEFLLPKMKNMNELIQRAEFLGLKIIPKAKHVLFEFDGIKISEQELVKTNQYSVSYFQDYFNNKNETVVLDNKNLVERYNEEKLIKEKKLPTEDGIWKSYQDFKRNRDAVHEFEVELNLNQVEEVVEDGIYIKVQFGIRQEGLIFVPNIQINMEEEKVKVFLRETSSYYVYHKDSAEKNRFMKGKTLIRQFNLQYESQYMYRRIPLSKIKEKIEQLDFLISSETSSNTYEDITKDFIDQISYLENMIQQVQDKIDNLSSLEEILLNDMENGSGNLEDNINVKISVDTIEKDLFIYKGRLEKLKEQHREAINLFEMFNRTIKNYQKTKNTKSIKENEIHIE